MLPASRELGSAEGKGFWSATGLSIGSRCHHLLEALTVGAADVELGTILQDECVLTVEPWDRLADAGDVYDGRAMDPDKQIRIQACFYRGHRRANGMAFRSAKNVDVVPCCADVVNIARAKKKVLAFAANDERRGVGPGGNGRSAGGS